MDIVGVLWIFSNDDHHLYGKAVSGDDYASVRVLAKNFVLDDVDDDDYDNLENCNDHDDYDDDDKMK